MASMHLDDDSFQWHVAIERRWQGRWLEYSNLLRNTFGLPFKKPMAKLTHLRQAGSLANFNVKFDAISAKLHLSEEYLINVYIAALKDEIAASVLMFKPRTLLEARRLARLQEIVINHRQFKNGSEVSHRPSSFASSSLSVSNGDRNSSEVKQEVSGSSATDKTKVEETVPEIASQPNLVLPLVSLSLASSPLPDDHSLSKTVCLGSGSPGTTLHNVSGGGSHNLSSILASPSTIQDLSASQVSPPAILPVNEMETPVPFSPPSTVPSSLPAVSTHSLPSSLSPSLSWLIVPASLDSWHMEMDGCVPTKHEGVTWQAIECFAQELVVSKFEKSASLKLYCIFSALQKEIDDPLDFVISHGHMGLVLYDTGPVSLPKFFFPPMPTKSIPIWLFLLYLSVTRCLLQIWYKGNLIKMLQGSGLVQASVYLILDAFWDQLQLVSAQWNSIY